MSETTKTLFAFPGQGAQYPGIGSDIYDQHTCVKQTYQEASDVLGFDMAELSFSDPNNEINLTRNTQPVLVTHHIACLRVFKELNEGQLQADFTAGHSLGEYSALVAADSLSFEQALKLVRRRGELMGEFGEGEMEALTLELDDARALADEFYCGVAACNMQDQTVVGGKAEDLEALAIAMKDRFPRKRSTRLKTEGAFHTYYMVEAAKHFREVLDQNNFAQPTCKVLSNYAGDFHNETAESIRSRLFLQLFNPVLWHTNLNHAIDNGITQIIEFGGGIGRGETPVEKRANLEGIVKKKFRQSDNPPVHLSVINQISLEATLEAVS